MYLKSIELSGFKSFAKKSEFLFTSSVTAIVGPNGSGKSNIAEAFRFVLGEQSLKSLRGKKGEDLIWGGSNEAPRTGRASVKVVLDNTPASGPPASRERAGGRLFDVDFDEVEIERVVHRDGVNEYVLNGSKVRLRDVVELLAGANIGSSGHHIISQGEADHILGASPRERKDMVEDALGLRVFQYKIAESERKLLRTKENIEQVQVLRKEVAPHLKFLRRQVEKIEKAASLREELVKRYLEYLKREDVYVTHAKEELARARREPERRLAKLEQELNRAKLELAEHDKASKKRSEIMPLEEKLREVREEKNTLVRELGRLEGRVAAAQTAAAHQRGDDPSGKKLVVARTRLGELKGEVERSLSAGEEASDTNTLKELLRELGASVRSFIEHVEEKGSTPASSGGQGEELSRLQQEKEQLNEKHTSLLSRERVLNERYVQLQKEVDEAKDESREAERRVFAVMSQQNELRAMLAECERREEALRREERAFLHEAQEGVQLAGSEVLGYQKHEVVAHGTVQDKGTIVREPREKQGARRREIERMRVRVEEAGGGLSEEVMREYEEVRDRDAFLQKEIEDLERSAESLRKIIADLEQSLGTQFKEGIAKINKEFQNFFTLMFNGGSASLSVIREPKRRRALASLDEDEQSDEEVEEAQLEEGIDINVSLPSKRIRGLVMLSGGERALVSVALLFAMSQVNPPPFLVLDETDAALDEANSRRYGDMIEGLSAHSQLVLITHNRETMRRAGVLYGVTMGRDGISKVLSVNFDELATVAAVE